MELVVYALLILTSIIGLTFIIERAIALRWRRVLPPEVEAAAQSCQTASDVQMLRRVCQQHDSPMSRLLLQASEHLDWPKADNADALQTRARHEITRLERGWPESAQRCCFVVIIGSLFRRPRLDWASACSTFCP